MMPNLSKGALPVAEICKTLFLSIASLNLGFSSGLEWLGFIFFAAFLYLGVRDVRNVANGFQHRNPPYRKLFAYGAIVPCSIWWVLTPGVEYGVSPWIVFIPGFYLLFLAFLQKRSLGNGGYEAFVAFDGTAALLFGFFQASRPSIILGIVGVLLALHSYARPKTPIWKHALFLLLFVQLGGAAYGGWKYWKSHYHYNGKYARDYEERHRVMGFSPVVTLGSFSSNYSSRYNSQVILRVWDSLAPEYLRAAVYEKYVAGIWKLPSTPAKRLYPARYQVDYAVFETADSVTMHDKSKSVWVQSGLDNFGFLFAANNAVGVAAKNADSLDYFSAGVFSGANGNRSDWYYFVQNEGPDSKYLDKIEIDSGFIQIGKFYEGFVDSAASEMNLLSQDPDTVATQIREYFLRNFKYSLVVPGVDPKQKNREQDPLRTFWRAKEGYCEYYATMAIHLFRHQGIPARYVTGFAHPERVAGRPYVQFRRHHSHAWVEVFAHNQWLHFDPTPPMLGAKYKAPSWFQIKWEGIQGRAARFFHILKEGEWRRAVDSWQNVSELIFGSRWFYGALVLFLFAVLLLKYKGLRKRKAKSVELSLTAQEWILRLDSAEKILGRNGFYRESGETVAAFYSRVKNSVSANRPLPQKLQAEEIHKSLEILSDYNLHRWK